MEVKHEQRGEIAILRVHGSVTSGVVDDEFRRAISGVVTGEAARLILDLGGVTLIDSSGIGELLRAHNTITRRGGALKLLHTPPMVQDVLQITRLLTVFEVFEDEESAIASFD
jgi:anti-sigma B factor antagonist